VFKTHRLWYHSTLGSRVIKQKKSSRLHPTNPHDKTKSTRSEFSFALQKNEEGDVSIYSTDLLNWGVFIHVFGNQSTGRIVRAGEPHHVSCICSDLQPSATTASYGGFR